MRDNASLEHQPTSAPVIANNHVALRDALDQWMGVVDAVLNEDLDASKRAELRKGADQLKEIVESMFGSADSVRQPE